jgi:ADP-ribose pyrophosphatase YjhB (NUDIX family)
VGHYCVNCGAPLVMRTIEGRDYEACPNDEYVLWRDPKVATAVVVEVGDGVVLGRRGIEPGYGLWCLPGGFVNDDEDPARAAIRECAEEINAAVELTGLLGVYHIGKTTASSIVGIAYRGRLADGETISPGPEMLEVAVFPPNELPPIAFPSHEAVLAAYVRSRERPAGPELLNAAAAAQSGVQPSPGRGTRKPQPPP